jgi:hypothetical protein
MQEVDIDETGRRQTGVKSMIFSPVIETGIFQQCLPAMDEPVELFYLTQ